MFSRDAKIVNPACFFSFFKSNGYGNFMIDFQSFCPEIIIDLNLIERNRFYRIIMISPWIFPATRRKQQNNRYQYEFAIIYSHIMYKLGFFRIKAVSKVLYHSLFGIPTGKPVGYIYNMQLSFFGIPTGKPVGYINTLLLSLGNSLFKNEFTNN